MKRTFILAVFMALLAPWVSNVQAQSCTQTITPSQPYFEGFEAVTGGITSYTSSTGRVLPDCWLGYTNAASTTTNPTPYMPSVASGNGSYIYRKTGAKGLNMTSGTSTTYGNTKYVLLPPMSVPLSQLQLSFWMCTENANNYGVLTVGYVTADDTATFVALQSYPASTATQHDGNGLMADGVGLDVELSLASVPATATRIAFRWRVTNSFYTCCLDDIMVGYIPSCPRISSLAVADVASSQVTLQWTAGGSETAWEVKVYSASDSTLVSTTTATTAGGTTVTGLAENTNYYAEVRAQCTPTDISQPRSVSFRTRCAPLSTLPYTYGFEDASTSGATGTFNPCWGRNVEGSTTAYPYPYTTQKRSGLFSLYMYSATAVHSWTTLPAFTTPVTGLYLSFWAMKTSANYGRLAVGVMSDPDDISTFDTVATMQVSALNTWENFDVDFSSYAGTGQYIAILAPKGATNFAIIDDISLLPTPTCFRPLELNTTLVHSTSATLTWPAVSPAPARYIIQYDDTDFDPHAGTALMVSTTDTFYTLTGLTGSTNYYVKVASYCGGTDTSRWAETRFETRCPAVTDLPYDYGFENATGSTTVAVNIPCWSTGMLGTTSNYPYPSTTQKRSGSKSLYFNSTATIQSWAALPAFAEPLNNLYLTFWAYKTSANYGRLAVGVMSNPDDLSTFDTIAEIQVSATSTWEKFEFNFVNYSGNGQYIAILAPNGASNYAYVDDINVKQAPACLRPDNVRLTAVASSSATVAWTPARTPQGYFVVIDTLPVNPDTIANPDYVVTPSFNAVGLNPGTTYYLYVAASCTGNDTSNWTTPFSFTTLCTPLSLPYTQVFDSLPTSNSAPSDIDCHAHHGYVNVIASRTGFDGKALRFYPNSSTAPNIFILPEFEQEISNLYMTYVTAPEGIVSGSFDVGYVTNVIDSSSFVPVAHYDQSLFYSTGSLQPLLLDALFTGAPAGARIAFRHNVNATNYYWFLDDINVMPIPSCMRPAEVTVTGVTGTSAELNLVTINPASSYLAVMQAVGDTLVHSINISGTYHWLSDLTPGTTYAGYVYALCGVDTSVVGAPFAFTTDCNVLDLPFTMDGEHVWQGTASAPVLNCWDFHNLGNTSYNWRYSTTTSQQHSENGTYSYYYYGSTSTTNEVNDWMITPWLNFTGMESVSMWVKTGSATTTPTYHARLSIYASHADSTEAVSPAAFQRLVITGDSVVNNRVDIAGNTWQYLTIRLPETLTGERRLALVVDTQCYTFYIDDASIYTRSACPSVADVAVTDVDTMNAVVSWVDTNSLSNYYVTYWPENAAAGDTISTFTTDTTTTLTNLQPNTTYYVYVQADCSGDLSVATFPVNFRTNCVVVADSDLPFVEDFEEYGSGATQPISYCWYKGTNAATAYPYPYTTAAVRGSRGLYFYGNNASNYYSYAVLPAFATSINDLMIEFDIKRYNLTTSTYHSIIHVGVMNDPTDITTFDTLGTFDLTSYPADASERVYQSFEGYNGTGRIALLAPSVEGSSHVNYVYVDSVVVKHLPACRWPYDLAASNVSAGSVDLTWQGSASNFYVEASTSADFATVAASATASATNTTLTGLDDFTRYYVRVRSLCGNDSSLWSNVATFVTPLECAPGSVAVYDTLRRGTTTSYTNVLNGYSSYSRGVNWHIFTASDLQGMGIVDTLNLIRGINLETGSVSGQAMPFRIYMAETDLNEWHATSETSTTGITDTIPIDSMQLVFDGSFRFVENSWNEVPLTTAFNYSGMRNLVVAFVRDEATSGSTYFKYGTIQNYQNAYLYVSGASVYTYRQKYGANMAFVACNGAPSCVRPTAVSITDMTPESVTLGWTGSASSYTVLYDTVNFDPFTATSGLTTTATTTSATLTGLTPNTTYYISLRSNCGSEQSLWTRPIAVTTPCALVDLPYSENFDTYAASTTAAAGQQINTCWYKGTNSSTAYPYLTTSQKYSPNNSLYFYATSTSYSYAALSGINADLDTVALNFRALKTSAAYGHIVVGVMVDPTDYSTFTPYRSMQVEEMDDWESFEVYFDQYTGPGSYIAFLCPDGASNHFYLDNVELNYLPSCIRPDSVVSRNVTGTSATVAWTGTAANYQIEYGPRGFEHGTGIRVLSSIDTVNLTGLSAGVTYEAYVRAICAAGDTSNWSNPARFNTTCGPRDLPLVYNWEYEATGSSAALPHCWTRFCNGTTSTYYPYVNSASANAYSGSKYFYYNFSTTATHPDDQAIISPEIDTTLVPNDSIEVSFWAKSTVNNRTIQVGILSNPIDMTTYTLIGTVTLSTTYQEFFVNTAAYTGNGNHIVFRAMKDTTSSYSIYLDDVRIDRLSPCPRANNLAAHTGTATSVQLEWTDTIGSTQWVVEYGELGGSSTQTVTVTSNPYTLTGLTPNTAYRFRVAPICADGTVAMWNRDDFVPFSTALNPATVPYSYDFETAAEWANWQTSSNNNVNWYRGNVAEENTTNAAYLSADGGATHSWNMGSITNAVAYRDIDFGTDTGSYTLTFDAYMGGTISHNYDGVSVLLVDPATYVESSNTGLTSPWGHLNNLALRTVRRDTTWGSYTAYFDNVSGVKRMVFYHFNQSTAVNNPYYDHPSAIDNIAIVQQPCPRPTGLDVVNVTSTNARITWEGDASDTYVVTYRVSGTPASTSIYDTITGTTYVIAGLAPTTTYVAWVARACSPTDVSPWSDGVSFSTLCAPMSLPFLEDFNSTFDTTFNAAGVLPECWDGYSNGTNATYMPHVVGSGSYWYSNDTTNALTLTSGSSSYGDTKIVALPQFNVPVNGCTVRFYYRMENANNGTLELGYITGNDLESFQPSATVASTTTLTQANYTLTGIPANATRIAFRWIHTSSYYSVGIDNIQVSSTIEPCDVPLAAVSDATHNTVTVNFHSEADSFQVAIMPGRWMMPDEGTGVADTTFTFSGLTHQTPYSIGVRAVCAEGFYSDWTVLSVTTLQRPCLVPTAVTVSDISFDAAVIGWTPGENETQWEVNVTGPSYDQTFNANTNPYAVTGLASNETYTVRVRALCSETQQSEWSTEVQFTTERCQPVSGVTATATTFQTATVSWNPASNGSGNYELEYGLSGFRQGDGTRVTVTGATTYTIAGLDAETNYDVYVRSICSASLTSSWSTVATFTTPDAGGTEQYTVTVNYDQTRGTVIGAGTYYAGTQVTLTATSNPGYRFAGWSNGEADSNYTFILTENVTLTANFEETVGIDDVDATSVSLYPNPATTTVTLTGLEPGAKVTIVDLNGREISKFKIQNSKFEIDVTSLASGAYYVRITGQRQQAVRKLIVK